MKTLNHATNSSRLTSNTGINLASGGAYMIHAIGARSGMTVHITSTTGARESANIAGTA